MKRAPLRLIFLLLHIVMLSLAPTKASAVMAVIDAKNLVEARNILSEAKKQLDQLKQTYTTMTQQLDAVTGINDFSDLLGDPALRKWMPGSVEEMSDMINRGYNPGVLGDRIDYYQAKFPSINPADINPYDPESLQRAYYEEVSTLSTYNLSAADYLFEKAHEAIDELSMLSKKADKNQTIKESIDFNNTLMVRVAQLQQSVLELQTLQLKTAALTQQYEVSDIARNTTFFAHPIP